MRFSPLVNPRLPSAGAERIRTGSTAPSMELIHLVRVEEPRVTIVILSDIQATVAASKQRVVVSEGIRVARLWSTAVGDAREAFQRHKPNRCWYGDEAKGLGADVGSERGFCPPPPRGRHEASTAWRLFRPWYRA